MDVIPAVDVQGGRCVRLRQGVHARATVYADDPLVAAQRFIDAGATRLHIVDLDAARGFPVEASVAAVTRIVALCVAAGCAVQVGGGIRSVDAGEKRFVHEQGLDVFDMRHIDEMGMRQTMEHALAGLDGDTHLHVSFDVDFLDPDIAPGVGTTVPGGPTYREAQLCMEMIADTRRLGSLDIVELNPAFDVRNKTAALAVDLIASLFGKSTLVRHPVWRRPAHPSGAGKRSARATVP